MQCEAPRVPLVDTNQRSGNAAAIHFPGGLGRNGGVCFGGTACEGDRPFAAPSFAHPSALRPNASPAFSVNRPYASTTIARLLEGRILDRRSLNRAGSSRSPCH